MSEDIKKRARQVLAKVKYLTWGEFKAKVEEQGVTDEDTFLYIDAPGDGPPVVSREDDGRVVIE
jgi:hypothetical protein